MVRFRSSRINDQDVNRKLLTSTFDNDIPLLSASSSSKYYTAEKDRRVRLREQHSLLPRLLLTFLLLVIFIVAVSFHGSKSDYHQRKIRRTFENHNNIRLDPHISMDDDEFGFIAMKSRASSSRNDTEEIWDYGSMDFNVETKTKGSKNNKIQQEIIEETLWSWDAYEKYAFGYDELQPLSQTGDQWFSLGLTLVDSLDTLLILGLTEEFNRAREWVETSLHFDKDIRVNLFETTIRVLGGLLSAYTLNGNDKLFLEKAIDLGERLIVAFDTDTKIPLSDVNLKKRTAHSPTWGSKSSTSETSTLHLEFCYLSYLTHRPEFCNAVSTTSDALAKYASRKTKFLHLLPIYVDPNTGRFSGEISLGSRGDSYYEYLLKSWLQSGRRDNKIKQRYMKAIDAIRKHLVQTSKPNNLVYISELSKNGKLSPKMDHLVCFLPGTLALGAHYGAGGKQEMKLAQELLETCWQTYARQPTGLGPEIVFFSGGEDFIVKRQDSHNLLRPETAESLFILWRLTHDPQYRQYGRLMFESFKNYARVETGGYASISSVLSRTKVDHIDKMESFWLGETLKYLYLLFSDDTIIPLDKYVLNTEAHPFPVLYN